MESRKWLVGILSDMDAEIAALEGKLSKARHRSCREHARRCAVRRQRRRCYAKTAGQAGYDVRVVDPAKRSGAGGEGEVGVSVGVKLLTQLFSERL